MLLFVSGPSTVAVKLGASVTLRTMLVVVGLRWKVAGVAPGTEVSCQPEKPMMADRFPRVSASLRLSVMLHEPLASVCVEKFWAPSTEDV